MVPWYTWAIAAVPIGAGVLWYLLRQVQKGRVEEIKRSTAEGYVKSEAERRTAEKQVLEAMEKAKNNEAVDFSRW